MSVLLRWLIATDNFSISKIRSYKRTKLYIPLSDLALAAWRDGYGKDRIDVSQLQMNDSTTYGGAGGGG